MKLTAINEPRRRAIIREKVFLRFPRFLRGTFDDRLNAHEAGKFSLSAVIKGA